MVTAPHPNECVRKCLLENATVTVPRGTTEYEAVVVVVALFEMALSGMASLPSNRFVYFFTIAATQPPLYGAESVTTPPPSIVFFIRR